MASDNTIERPPAQHLQDRPEKYGWLIAACFLVITGAAAVATYAQRRRSTARRPAPSSSARGPGWWTSSGCRRAAASPREFFQTRSRSSGVAPWSRRLSRPSG